MGLASFEFEKKRLAISVMTLVVGVLAATAVKSTWTSYELKSGGAELVATLWRYELQGKDISEQGAIRAEIDGRKTKNYRAFELARVAAVSMLVSAVAVAGLYGYVAVKRDFAGCPRLEFAAALLLLLNVGLAWAGAAYFKERMESNPWTDAAETKHEVRCAAGCGLTILNGLLLLNLAVACLALLYQEGALPGCRERASLFGALHGVANRAGPKTAVKANKIKPSDLPIERDLEAPNAGEETKEMPAAEKGD